MLLEIVKRETMNTYFDLIWVAQIVNAMTPDPISRPW